MSKQNFNVPLNIISYLTEKDYDVQVFFRKSNIKVIIKTKDGISYSSEGQELHSTLNCVLQMLRKHT